MVNLGALVSITMACDRVAVLPAASVTSTVTVLGPSPDSCSYSLNVKTELSPDQVAVFPKTVRVAVTAPGSSMPDTRTTTVVFGRYFKPPMGPGITEPVERS